MAPKFLILNGPNLNLLGRREPEIYGATTLPEIEALCAKTADSHSVSVEFHQSNDESELVGRIQAASDRFDALIINPAGYSFTSIAILDAIRTFSGPFIEVHLSNIHARDELHRHSVLSQVAKGVICGFGPYGYVLAVGAAARLTKKEQA